MCRADNLTTFMCLNLLGPSGSVQDCIGNALPLQLLYANGRHFSNVCRINLSALPISVIILLCQVVLQSDNEDIIAGHLFLLTKLMYLSGSQSQLFDKVHCRS